MYRRNRVVVTGMGVVAPNGVGVNAFWQTLMQGKSGIGPITHFDASGHAARIAGEIKGFNPLDYIAESLKPARMARHTQLALTASYMALHDADWPQVVRSNGYGPVPVALGVSSSAFDLIESGMEQMRKRGPHRVSSSVVNSSPPQAVAGALATTLGVSTECYTLSTACSAGLDAIATAASMIRSGKADIAIAGGADAPITPLAFATFASAGLASERNEEPERASRPFDRDRDSGVVSEGAAIVVLENMEHAIARGAKMYLEISGYAGAMDPDPKVPGSGLEQTMSMALANAGRRQESVDYICAHGAGHPVLDRIETEMIKRVFGKRAHSVPVSSIKGVTGNPLAAAGPMQLIACGMAFEKGRIPPTANYEVPDPECDLDYVPGKARAAKIRCALINIHGIGGSNGTLVVERIMPS